MVEPACLLISVSVLLDSQEATVRKVTLPVLLFGGGCRGWRQRETSRANGSLSLGIALWVDSICPILMVDELLPSFLLPAT